jgi:hypothetical protein
MVKKPQKKVNKTAVERRKVSNFDLVAQGKCPHDKSKLGDEVAGKGEGITRTCKKCHHVWYLNHKVHTCACRTCQKAKRR